MVANSYFEIVDYTLSTDFEVFIGLISQQLSLLTLYKSDVHHKHFSYLTSHNLLQYYDLPHCILIHSEIDRAKVDSSAFQIASKLEVPVFCDIGLGWFSGYLALPTRLLNYQLRSAFHCKLTTESQWLACFRDKFNPRTVKCDAVQRLRVKLLQSTYSPMHSALPSLLFAPFIPYGPMHEIIHLLQLTPMFDNILLHNGEEIGNRLNLEAASSMKLSIELDSQNDTLSSDTSGHLSTLSSTMSLIAASVKNLLDMEDITLISSEGKGVSNLIPSLSQRASTMFRDGADPAAISASSAGGSSCIDQSDINETIFYLFQTCIPASPDHAFIIPPPTKLLASQVKGSILVPIDSFLWHFSLKLIDSCGPTSSSSLRTREAKLVPFMMTLWVEIVKKFRMAWEAGILVPRIAVSVKESVHDLHQLLNDNPDHLGVELGFNLLHQKLQMLQLCCISKWKRGEYGDLSNYDQKQAQQVAFEAKVYQSFDGIDTRNKGGNGRDTSAKSRSTVSALSKKLFGYNPPAVVHSNSSDADDQISRLFDGLSAQAQEESGSSSQVLFEDTTQHLSVGVNMIQPKSVLSEPSSWTSDKSWDRIAKLDNTSLKSPLLKCKNFEDDILFISEDPHNVLDDDLFFEAVEPCDGPEGRRELIGTCLSGSDMWSPITQEPARFMTIDMIRDHEAAMELLGTSSDAAKQRARMQSAHLKSDMEAFKAANPGCFIEDFVKWHSPKDFQDGALSLRMSSKDNLWHELWKKTRAIPVLKQRLLFDYEAEAKQVLDFFAACKPSFILSQLLPTFFLAAYHTLLSNPIVPKLPALQFEVQVLGKMITKVNWDSTEDAKPEDMQVHDVICCIREVEEKIGLATSLLQKFPDEFRIVECILCDSCSSIVDDSERKSVIAYFKERAVLIGQQLVFEELCQSDGTDEQPIKGCYNTGNRMFVDLNLEEKRFLIAETISERYY